MALTSSSSSSSWPMPVRKATPLKTGVGKLSSVLTTEM